MARITMRKVQETKISEVFSLYLASAAAKGVKDKTLKTWLPVTSLSWIAISIPRSSSIDIQLHMNVERAASSRKPPNIISIPRRKSLCLFTVFPTFGIHSYEISHLAKIGFSKYYEDTKKE